MPTNEELHSLIEKYLNGTASTEEEAILMSWYRTVDQSHIEIVLGSPGEKEDIRRRMLKNLKAHAGANSGPLHHSAFQPGNKYNAWWRVAAAAVIILAAGIYFWFQYGDTHPVQAKNVPGESRFKNDVLPGGDKATLTLANGTQIILDSAANGMLSQQGNSVVNKTRKGELKYEVRGTKYEVAYNTLSTPNGGQYQLVLPDGSKVWLNAASSIRYPTAFMGNERKVEITGEAYFEVTKNQGKPFKVYFSSPTGGGHVEVLGTHFNINAYIDEATIKTTLLEGSVKVSKNAASAILKPGEQASISQSSNTIPVQTADVDEVVAWKNGRFEFNGNNIQSVMRQLGRWYDIEVSYEGSMPEVNFMGGISRQENISEVLKMLEITKAVKFKIEGKKIIVTK